MKLNGNVVGVCSWSLQPVDSTDLIRRVKSLGLDHAQIALAPLVNLDQTAKDREINLLLESGLSFTAGMLSFRGEDYSTIAATRRTCGFVPDDLWAERARHASDAVPVAIKLRLTSVTTHVGFVPPPGKPGHDLMVQRVREIANMLADTGIGLLLETGQEPANELLEFIQELQSPTVGINFDPANMILYGLGDPIAAIKMLGRWIRHVHVKDAIASELPGQEWGTEVPFGTGQVGAKKFLNALRAIAYTGSLIIEREAGDRREQDVRTAIAALKDAARSDPA
jgi:sugar phosphate isomerase/epimerase